MRGVATSDGARHHAHDQPNATRRHDPGHDVATPLIERDALPYTGPRVSDVERGCGAQGVRASVRLSGVVAAPVP